MHRFDKSSIWTAAGFAFVSGVLVLPTLSSANGGDEPAFSPSR